MCPVVVSPLCVPSGGRDVWHRDVVVSLGWFLCVIFVFLLFLLFLLFVLFLCILYVCRLEVSSLQVGSLTSEFVWGVCFTSLNLLDF